MDPAAPKKLEKQADALARKAQHLDESAGVVKESAVQLTGSADRRTELAADRTLLAAERTYAAWVRTGLASLASGIGARALLKGLLPGWLVGTTGTILILFSAFCFLAAVWRQTFVDISRPAPDTRRFPSALIVAFNGLLVLVATAALIGIWFEI
jgi:putative membrane protein